MRLVALACALVAVTAGCSGGDEVVSVRLNGQDTILALDSARGKAVFNGACSGCHLVGAAGAPKIGDKAAWAPRLAKGPAELVRNAIEGFIGASGNMPARGGGSALGDEDVAAAVAYLMAGSR